MPAPADDASAAALVARCRGLRWLLLPLGLLVGRGLQRGLELLHARLLARQRGLERRDLGLERGDLRAGGAEPLPRVERVPGDELMQEVDVALQATGALVEAAGFRAVLDPRDIL